MKNNKVKHFLSTFICLIMILLLLIPISALLERKASYEKYADFFEQDQDFDVLFFGTSHMINDVFPMELWNDYGIVSYNFGGHGNQLATSYWVMQNAFDYTTPKLVVIDCMLLQCAEKANNDFSLLHYSFDAFPLSKNKIAAAFDLLDDPQFEDVADGAGRTRSRLIWDFTIYHNRWNDLTSQDFIPQISPEKGAESRIAVTQPDSWEKIASTEKLNRETTGSIYLERMIQTCQTKGIDVLLTYLPYPAGEDEQKEANQVNEIAEKYGINYINFLELDLINESTDYYDSASHLNPSGARKITDYLGKFISANYSIPNQKENALYQNWEADYARYSEFKLENLHSAESLEIYLMLLSDKNYSCVVELSDDHILENKLYAELLDNIPNCTIQKTSSDIPIQISVYDKNSQLVDSTSWE